MWLLKMAWKNLWRNKHRTLITIAAVFFAVVLAIVVSSLQKGVFDNFIKNVVSFYSGYIQVHQKGYWDEQVLENSFEANKKIEKAIWQQPGITGITPRLESFALASSEQITKGCLVIGIAPLQEEKVTHLKGKIVHGSYLNAADDAALLSEGLARRLKLQVADTLVLIGQGYHGATAAGKYGIKGIVKFGSPELNDKTVYLSLPAAQALYSAEKRLTSYVLSIDDPDRLNPVAARVRKLLDENYEVMTWEQMMPDVKQHIQTDTASMSVIIGVLYLLICFGIFGTLLMMMAERRYEMGMLVAIGMNKKRLCGLLLAESVFTVIIGCLLGIITSFPLVYYLQRHPIRFGGEVAKVYEKFGFEAIFPTATDAQIFIRQALVVLVIGLILSLYPVIHAWRLNPVLAMRR